MVVIKEKKELILPSVLESVEQAAMFAAKLATKNGFAEDALFGIDMAVREAVANAVKHGNQFDEKKRVIVEFESSEESLKVSIKDEGRGFELDEVPDPTNPANLLKASGRGILFMRSFMDAVEWINHSEGGTIVRMIKKH
jgi:serine/threonine-protein kinase RsbW